MWIDAIIEDGPRPDNLCHYDGRLYWLVDDEEADPTEDNLGRTVARKQLVSYDIKQAERRTLAKALPPSPSLTVGRDGAYLWGLQQASVLRVDDDGTVGQLTHTEQQPDGALEWVDGRLYFVGKLNPATTGVAVYEPEADRFRRVLETGDPTPSTLDRVHIGKDRVFYLTHEARGWVLQTFDIAGGEDEEVIGEHDRMFRRLAGSSKGFLVCDDHALYLWSDGLQRLSDCSVPPEHIGELGARALWTTAAMENDAGELVEPWRVYAVDLEPGSTPEDVYESDQRIAQLAYDSWGFACLLREAKVGVVAEIGTHSEGRIVMVSPR